MKTSNVMLYKASMVTIFAAVGVAAISVYTKNFDLHKSSWAGIVITLALVSTVVLALRRDTYLPFLGKAAMPLGMLQTSFPAMADTKISVRAPGATHVIYWAAERDAPDPYTAYAETSNGGLAAVVGGVAILKFKTPGQYSVFRGTLPRHVHWRAVYPNGMVSRVETTNVSV
jgi:hypothetical protein